MIRTRFAPSPTGFLHVGGLRSALYNFLFARKHGGKFLLRIEDTDKKRTVAGAVENLIAMMKWAGLEYDEGPEKDGPHAPYIQSQRLALYQKFAQQLLEKGVAYRCFCTTERLEEMRSQQQEHKQAPMYDRRCAGLSHAEIEKNIAAKIPFAVRQNIGGDMLKNKNRDVEWTDLVRGNVSFQRNTIDDQVLLKSDGFPTYHLANVVDDHLMEITHVIRGEEWLSSTPKHILLYCALGWEPPQFAHLPLLLNKDRSKLSKRQGDVAVEDYKLKGYLPEALVNFVALLGWHPGGDGTKKGETAQEIFSLTELVEKFSLEKVHRAGAVFDWEKLDWMNWQWRRGKFEEEVTRSLMTGNGKHNGADGDTGTARKSSAADARHAADMRGEKLIELVATYLPKEWLADRAFLKRCLKTVEEKALQNPAKIRQYLNFYFQDELRVDHALLYNQKMKVDAAVAKESLSAVSAALEKFEKFDEEVALKNCLSEVIANLGFKNGQVLWPTRVALTGEQFSPGVFEVLWALGKEKSIARLRAAL